MASVCTPPLKPHPLINHTFTCHHRWKDQYFSSVPINQSVYTLVLPSASMSRYSSMHCGPIPCLVCIGHQVKYRRLKFPWPRSSCWCSRLHLLLPVLGHPVSLISRVPVGCSFRPSTFLPIIILEVPLPGATAPSSLQCLSIECSPQDFNFWLSLHSLNTAQWPVAQPLSPRSTAVPCQHSDPSGNSHSSNCMVHGCPLFQLKSKSFTVNLSTVKKTIVQQVHLVADLIQGLHSCKWDEWVIPHLGNGQPFVEIPPPPGK